MRVASQPRGVVREIVSAMSARLLVLPMAAVAAIFTDRDPAPICAETVARAARGEMITNETLDEIVRNVSTPRTQNA
jgi:hypothetical protein